MWIRKLHRMGTSVVLTVPVAVMRRWEQANVHHVLVTLEDDQLRIRPLATEDLMKYPAPQEEEVPPGAIR